MRKFNEVVRLEKFSVTNQGGGVLATGAAVQQKSRLAFASRSSRYGEFASESTHSTQHTKLHPFEPGARARCTPAIIAIPHNISPAPRETYIHPLSCLSPQESRGQIKFGSVCSFRARPGKLFHISAITLIPKGAFGLALVMAKWGQTLFDCESSSGTAADYSLWLL